MSKYQLNNAAPTAGTYQATVKVDTCYQPVVHVHFTHSGCLHFASKSSLVFPQSLPDGQFGWTLVLVATNR
jgi:hypothetical protein